MEDYLGRKIPRTTTFDKVVLCVRCLNAYNLNTAPMSQPEKLNRFFPHCPKCKCKIYYS